MRVSYCHLPLARLHQAVDCASNDPVLATDVVWPVNISCASNVRLLRRVHDADSARFVLSGKLADVCAALDMLAAEEGRMARRVAMQ